MVYFTCDRCGESLKKNEVDKHGRHCGSDLFCCIDCNNSFTSVTYQTHFKCLTEEIKYGGMNVPVEKKGDVKQNLWVQKVESAIESLTDMNLKQMLRRIPNLSCIPRKEAKFINFLTNSMGVRDRKMCAQAWQYIYAATTTSQSDETAKIETTVQDVGVKVKLDSGTMADGNRALQTKCLQMSTAQKAPEQVENGRRRELNCGATVEQEHEPDSKHLESGKFHWKKCIKRTLKESEDGCMRIKKLRKAVLSKYSELDGEIKDKEVLCKIFTQKLSNLRVSVDGNVVNSKTN